MKFSRFAPPSYKSVEGYIATRAFAEAVRRSAAGGGEADCAGLQKAFESITECDVGGFRVNLRAKKYESVWLVDLVRIMPGGKVVR